MIHESSVPVGYCAILIEVGAIGIDDGSVLIRDRSVVVYYLACVVVGRIIQNGNDEGLLVACVVLVSHFEANLQGGVGFEINRVFGFQVIVGANEELVVVLGSLAIRSGIRQGRISIRVDSG